MKPKLTLSIPCVPMTLSSPGMFTLEEQMMDAIWAVSL